MTVNRARVCLKIEIHEIHEIHEIPNGWAYSATQTL